MKSHVRTGLTPRLMSSSYTWEKPNELIYRLRGLSMGGAILHIGAHPDDEDVGLVAYLAHKYGVPASFIGQPPGAKAGKIELVPTNTKPWAFIVPGRVLRARSVDGGEALFGPFYDFGFSKSGEDTLAKWGGREAVTREVVRAIRWVQPQILIGRWTGRPSDGHGHHQAVGAVTLDAFEAAGDPDRFSELQEQGLVPWQPRKLYYSTGGDWQPGEVNDGFGALNREFEREGFVRVNTGELDPIPNRTYQEQAWVGFNNHKTQAMGFAPDKGPFYYYYALARSLVPVSERETGLYDGLDSSLAGLADYPGNGSVSLRKNLEAVQAKAKTAFGQYRAEDAMQAAEPILEALSILREVQAGLEDAVALGQGAKRALAVYLERKTRDFEEVTAECVGVGLECLSERARITPGEKFRVTARLWNHRKIPMGDVEFSFLAPADCEIQSAASESLRGSDISREAEYAFVFSKTAELTCPYWLVRPRAAYHYQWPADRSIGQPFDPPLVELECKLTMGGHQITLKKAAVFREAFPGGYRELSLAVVPPISVQPHGNSGILASPGFSAALGFTGRGSQQYGKHAGGG